jgi:hypothetical protein
MSSPTPNGAVTATPAGPTVDQIWRHLAKASFAVLGHVSATGEPRCSGVVYRMIDHRMFVIVAADSWKARHIAEHARVAVTVPVRRGGIRSMVVAIPPATITFHGSAVVHPPTSAEGARALTALAAFLPPERKASCRVVEIRPQGWFLTYGIGVPLMKMRDPARARARVPVT